MLDFHCLQVHDDDNEADVVGCRRLKVENVKPISPNSLEVMPYFIGIEVIFYETVFSLPLVNNMYCVFDKISLVSLVKI